MDGIDSPNVDRMLLATDFSRWTENAVRFAFGMAQCFGAEVFMVHAIEPIAGAAVDEEDEEGSFDDFFGDLTEKSRRGLEQLVAEAEAMGVSARFHIEIGERWRIIVEYAEKEDVDLIVLGRRTFKDQRDLSLGTTSQRVYFGTDRPVLTVPGQPDGPEAQPTSHDAAEDS